MTFGEKLLGLSAPPGDDAVSQSKKEYAAAIDRMNDFRASIGAGEASRLASVAITEAQAAAMWAEKALTWKD